MQNTDDQQNIPERPASIVCIAYRQLSLMTGIEDPTKPPCKQQNHQIERTRRVLRIPTFFCSTLCSAYRNFKGINESVALLLTSAENGLNEGVQLLNPITEKVGDALATPLQNIDDTLSVGLDFLEERVSPICDNITNSFRNLFGPTIEILLGNVTSQIQRLSLTDQQPDKNDQQIKKETTVGD